MSNKEPDKDPATQLSSIARHSLVLGLIALLAAVALGVVNLLTAERIIAQQREAERKALAEVFPASFHDNDLLADTFILDPGVAAPRKFDLLDALQLTSPRQAYTARLDGEFAGVILPAEAHDGYSGDILLLVGILADGSISGVRVLEHGETPGLGDKIELRLSDWILGFDGKTVDNPPASGWQVLKDGGEFDQLTGATITPRAIVTRVRNTLDFFEVNKARLANR